MERVPRVRWWMVLLAVLALGSMAFVLWASAVPAPMAEALAAMEPNGRVRVETDRWLAFRPADGTAQAGLVIYPGGRVDPRSYAPAAHTLAARGYLAVIVPMPLNLAVLGAGRAAAVIEAFPGVESWAVGGHSLGGAMAAQFAGRHLDMVQGLVLWAAYPSGADDLSATGLRVVSIYGTRDGLASVEQIKASRALLPADSRLVAIEGGNHAGFAWYGEQAGDQTADIPREEQQRHVVEATLELLASLEEVR
jgi:hypothetical protein